MDEALTCTEIDEQSSFLVRQPIFTRDKTVWGYELITEAPVVMEGGGLAICMADMVEAFKDILSATFGELAEGQKIVLNINYDNFCDKPAVSAWENCVFSLSFKATKSLECVNVSKSIHDQGGTLALEGHASLDDCGGLLDKSDYIHVSLAELTPPEIVAFRKKFKDTRENSS